MKLVRYGNDATGTIVVEPDDDGPVSVDSDDAEAITVIVEAQEKVGTFRFQLKRRIE